MILVCLILFIIIAVLLLVGLQYLCYHTRNAEIFNQIPGPPKLFIIGNMLDYLLEPVKMFTMCRYHANTYKDLYSVQIGSIKIANITNPEDAEILLSNSRHITKSFVYDFLHPWLQQGLLTSAGEKWHQRRKILTPAFHFNILRQFCKTFDDQSQLLIKNIKSQKSQVLDVVPLINQFTLNSLCESAMGVQNKSSEGNLEKYKKAVYVIGKLVVDRIVRVWYHPDIIYKLTPMYRIHANTLSILHDFSTTVIRQRRIDRDAANITHLVDKEDPEDEIYMKSNKKRLAMLDLLLSAEAEGKIDENGIREEVDTFTFEGHDTTSVSLNFTLMLLANNIDAQDKIIQELDKIFNDPNEEATIDHLNSMKYLELCLKESLRMYPSVPLISRLIFEDLQLKNFLVPKHTVCHVQILDMHRNAKLYPCPDDFIPERFTLENCAKRHPFAYIPFSAGPRNCIGQRFALYQLKSVVSKILRNFRLRPITKPKDVVFISDLVLRNRDPIYVQFVPRTGI